MEIRYLGDKSFPGLENPKIEQEKETIQQVITTGNLYNNSFPFSFTISNETNPIFDNMKFKGSCKEGEYPKLSSIISSKLNKEEEKAMLEIIQEVLKQIPILRKDLKINDSFTTSIPLKIPLGTFTIEMKVITRYTLKEIKKGTAYFDYAQNYSLNTEKEGITLTGKGSGKGKITYGIQEHFFLSDKSEANIEMGIKFENKSVQLKMKLNSEENTTVR
jgi:hypothetical protein